MGRKFPFYIWASVVFGASVLLPGCGPKPSAGFAADTAKGSWEGGTVNLGVLSNTRWRMALVDSVEWLRVETTEREGDGEAGCQLELNETLWERSARVAVRTAEGEAGDTVTVVQEAMQLAFIRCEERLLRPGDTLVVLDIAAAGSELKPLGCSWVRPAEPVGGRLAFAVEPYGGEGLREARFSVVTPQGPVECRFTQLSPTIRTVRVEKPGTLRQLLPAGEKQALRWLSVAGPLDTADLAWLRGCGRLELLDLGAVRDSAINAMDWVCMVPYSDGSGSHESKGTGTLFDYRMVVLPSGLERLGNEAFAGCNKLEAVFIPRSLRRLGQKAFKDCKSLRRVVFEPRSRLVEIRESEEEHYEYLGVFQGCSLLASIDLPQGLEYIGDAAFKDAGLLRVRLPESVRSLGWNVFWGCPLSEVTLPRGLKVIAEYCFAYCKNLKRIDIPDGVDSIGRGAFRECTALAAVNFGAGSKLRRAYYDGYYGDLAFYEDYGSNEECSAFTGCTALRVFTAPPLLGDIRFAAELTGMRVELAPGHRSLARAADGSIYTRGDSVLVRYQPLTPAAEFRLPARTTQVEEVAFLRNGSLRSVILHDGVTRVGARAFEGCDSLRTVRLPEGIEKLEDGLFRDCPLLDSVRMPERLEWVSEAAFRRCASLRRIELPDSVWYIGTSAFEATGLESVRLPRLLSSLARYAFAETALREVAIPDRLGSLDLGTFARCKALSKVTFGRGSTLSGCYNSLRECFDETGIFDGTQVTKITYPATLTAMDVVGLVDTVVFLGTVPPTQIELHDFNPEWVKAIYVPRESVEAYATAFGKYDQGDWKWRSVIHPIR